jgi:hypothetical protein
MASRCSARSIAPAAWAGVSGVWDEVEAGPGVLISHKIA